MEHRINASKLLHGSGLEIGALHNPFSLPPNCSVEYLDIHDKKILVANFPELDPDTVVDVKYLGDVCKASIKQIMGKKFDFIIANHILEHVANPIQTLKNIWQGIKTNGYLVIAVPDKDYTFDKQRECTPFKHILGDYFSKADYVEDIHYLDFLCNVHPEVFASRDALSSALINVRNRHEHVHVWTSETFKGHLIESLNLLRHHYEIVFESTGGANKIEYFVVIKKLGWLKFITRTKPMTEPRNRLA